MTTDSDQSDERRLEGSTSRSLLAGARREVPAAWERLVRLYAPLVASWCRRWRVTEQDIPDLLQDVFSAVASHLDQFHSERPSSTFRGWLATITRNKIRDQFRRRAQEPSAAGGSEAMRRLQQIPETVAANFETEAEPPLDPDDPVVLNALLRNALGLIQGEFHERTWKAFWGVVVEGRAAVDVAHDLDMKPGSVRVAKSRVLLRLRRELGDVPP